MPPKKGSIQELKERAKGVADELAPLMKVYMNSRHATGKGHWMSKELRSRMIYLRAYLHYLSNRIEERRTGRKQ